MNFAELLAETEARRQALAESVVSEVFDFEVEDDSEQPETTETEGEAPKVVEGLSIEATARLIDTMSAGLPRTTSVEQDLGEDDDLEEEVSDAGRRSPGHTKESASSQFDRAVRGYRDGGSAPRGLDEARRRKSRNVRVFGPGN